MRDIVFDLIQGALIGSIAGFAIFSSYASYVNTNEILSLLKNPPVVEETLEQKIDRYKQFDQPHPSDSLFFEQRYQTPTITGTLL